MPSTNFWLWAPQETLWGSYIHKLWWMKTALLILTGTSSVASLPLLSCIASIATQKSCTIDLDFGWALELDRPGPPLATPLSQFTKQLAKAHQDEPIIMFQSPTSCRRPILLCIPTVTMQLKHHSCARAK